MSNKAIVLRRDLKSRYGIDYSPVHLSRLERAGRWPKRLRLSYKVTAYFVEEVEAELAKRAAERDQAA